MPDRVSIEELAARVLADAQASRLIVALSNDSSSDSRALAESMRAHNAPPTRLVENPSNMAEVAALVSEPGQLLVVSGLDQLGADGWRQLDEMRSRRFQIRGAPVVLFLNDDSHRLLEQNAPNVFSFAQGSVFSVSQEPTVLSETEREARLQALRNWARLSDREVLAAHEAGILPALPEFAEWLLLLRQG
jgi:hypothetical protein